MNEIHEAFEKLSERIILVDKAVAADLPGEGFFHIKWNMVCKLIEAGRLADDLRDAGNTLEIITEELPGVMNYANKHAAAGPDRSAGPTVAVLEEMLETTRTTLGDDVYQDMAMSHRRPPQPR
jgi:hypothetical protein